MMVCLTLVYLTWGGTHATGQDTCLRQFLRCHFLSRLIYQQITISNVNRALIRTERPFLCRMGRKMQAMQPFLLLIFQEIHPNWSLFVQVYFSQYTFGPVLFGYCHFSYIYVTCIESAYVYLIVNVIQPSKRKSAFPFRLAIPAWTLLDFSPYKWHKCWYLPANGHLKRILSASPINAVAEKHLVCYGMQSQCLKCPSPSPLKVHFKVAF